MAVGERPGPCGESAPSGNAVNAAPEIPDDVMREAEQSDDFGVSGSPGPPPGQNAPAAEEGTEVSAAQNDAGKVILKILLPVASDSDIEIIRVVPPGGGGSDENAAPAPGLHFLSGESLPKFNSCRELLDTASWRTSNPTADSDSRRSG